MTENKRFTETERLIKIVETLQNVSPDILTDKVVKQALSVFKKPTKKQIGEGAEVPTVVLPRSFPKKWGGSSSSKKVEGKPKGPRNAYIFFTTETRDTVKNENPDLSNSDIMKSLGEQWSNLSEEDKKPFVNMANTDKERYEREMEVWENANPEQRRKSSKTKVKQVEKNVESVLNLVDFKNLKVPQLRNELKKLGLNTKGVKEDLMCRLTEFKGLKVKEVEVEEVEEEENDFS